MVQIARTDKALVILNPQAVSIRGDAILEVASVTDNREVTVEIKSQDLDASYRKGFRMGMFFVALTSLAWMTVAHLFSRYTG